MSAPPVDASPTLADDAEGTEPVDASRRALGLVVFAGLLFVAVIASLMFGSNPLPFGDVWHVIWDRDGSEASSIV